MPSPQKRPFDHTASSAARPDFALDDLPNSPSTPEQPEMAILAATDMAQLFGPAGPVAALLEGYEERPSQTAMAQAVQGAILAGRHALIEAPTGTGKSIAYLIPALLSGQTVVVATANKSLQSQLFTKDIPFVGRVLGREIEAVLVKGRSNYLCTYKWEQELQEQRSFSMYDREHEQIAALRSWLTETGTGDVDELPFVLEGDLRPRIVSFADDCLQRECPHWSDACWVNFMRDQAADAQILVTNHHLLLNALELGMSGERILPSAAIYVVDEAHGLEQTATAVYEVEVSDYTVEQLLQRAILKLHIDEATIDDLRYQNSLAFQEVAALGKEATFVIEGELEAIRALSKAIEEQARDLRRLNPYGDPVENEERKQSEGRRSLELGIEALNSAASKLAAVATSQRDGDVVRYGERVSGRRHVHLELHAAPINPAGLLRRYLFEPDDEEVPVRTVICTSATLATDGSFAHLRRRFGITTECVEAILAPVFDYAQQALLYQPALPPYDWRNSDGYYSAVAAEVERLLEVSRGRALCLFTNWSGLQQVSRRVREGERSAIWPVRAQGDAPRDALLAWFRQTPHSVLLATRSFWEGVDIPGDDLSLVVLDKMPFPTPNDPLTGARLREIEQNGGDSFGGYMTPHMTLALKQGFGRLIRRATDRGVVAILDERLSSKGYGKQARRDLPPAQFSRDFKEVHRFFQRALPSAAEFALNIWSAPDEESDSMSWRWQLVRLQDGRADEEDGVLAAGTDEMTAAIHALEHALANLRARVERAGRSPADFAVEVRCAAEVAIHLQAPSSAAGDGAARGTDANGAAAILRAALGAWREVSLLSIG